MVLTFTVIQLLILNLLKKAIKALQMVKSSRRLQLCNFWQFSYKKHLKRTKNPSKLKLSEYPWTKWLSLENNKIIKNYFSPKSVTVISAGHFRSSRWEIEEGGVSKTLPLATRWSKTACDVTISTESKHPNCAASEAQKRKQRETKIEFGF